jgi:hypothetical protein
LCALKAAATAGHFFGQLSWLLCAVQQAGALDKELAAKTGIP